MLCYEHVSLIGPTLSQHLGLAVAVEDCLAWNRMVFRHITTFIPSATAVSPDRPNSSVKTAYIYDFS